MAGLFVDVEPLRVYPEFRRLWSCFAISQIGAQMSVVAVAVEVYKITGSNLDVGLISLVQLVPALVGALLGGSIADAMDRRKLLVCTGTVMSLLAIGLALNADRTHPSLLLLYVLAAINAGFQGVNAPALTAALLSSVLDRQMFVKANALRQLSGQIASVIGPSLAGILYGAFGVHIVFWVIAGTFLVAVGSVLTVGSHPPVGGATRFGWHSFAEGFAFLKGRQAIQGCLTADLNATILGMPTALFPALALHHFHGGPRLAGLLYAAPGFGSLLASGMSGWTNRVKRPGRAVCVAISIWGLGLAAFGLVDWIPAAVGFLAIAGGADVISAVFRSTILQTEAPDRLRGRLSAIQQAAVNVGPRLGNTEAGLVAAATNAPFSVVSGGIGCVVGIAVIAKLMPAFLHYRLGTEGDRSEEGSTVAS